MDASTRTGQWLMTVISEVSFDDDDDGINSSGDVV
jgi:hypothetical protein